MDKKEPIKISLSTFFLFIAIIVIIVMGYFIFKAFNDKTVVEEQNNNLNSQVNQLQEKINKVSEIANTTNSMNSNNSTNSNVKESEFSEAEIKEVLTKYLNIFKGKGSSEGVLEKLGLLKYGDYSNANLTDDNYIKTNIKYSDFKKKVLDIMTDECFNSINYNKKAETTEFKENDGLLYYSNSGMTGTEYEVKSVRIKGDYKDKAYIADVYTINLDDSKELNTIEFNIANVNGKCVISYCD